MNSLSRIAVVLALAVAVAAGALSAGTRTAAAIGDCTPASDWGVERGDLAAQALNLVNAHRATLGLRQLAVDPALQAAAVWKARHMAKYAYMAHDDPAPPVARSAAERLAACGYRSSWAENIAYGFPTAGSVVNGWLGSAGHRANIENPNFAAIGSGAAVSTSGQVYWAQTFGTTVNGVVPSPPPAPAPAPAPPPAPAPAPRPGPSPAPPGSPAPPPAPAVAGAKKASAGSSAVTLSGLTVTPRRPHAGQVLSSSVVVTKRGVRLKTGRVFCSARLEGRPLVVVARRLRGGKASCAWRLPAAARLKVVRATMIVEQGRLRALAPFRIIAS